MKLIKDSLVGLVLAGILPLAPTSAFAHGGGGGEGGGSFGGGGGHSGGGHLSGLAGHSFTQYQGAHFERHKDHFRHDRDFFFGGPFGYDYPYYGNYDDDSGDNAYGQSSPADVTPSQEIIIAVQKELTRLGYYHGRIYREAVRDQ
jgi:hypothetical protein